MAEQIEGRQVFSLYEVSRSLEKTIAKRYGSRYWIKAEMNKLNYYRHSGHCYPDLVEKRNHRVVAEMRAILWKGIYQKINQKFKRILHEPLRDGIKILFLAAIKYHPKYGLSLQIIDIDPGFTLGDLEREKQESLRQLRREKILTRNKDRLLPLLPQRIAVISVETSNGYSDFCNILNEAEERKGYAFYHQLFPSLLQGDHAARQMLTQLQKIEKEQAHFDVVVIVRGGGGAIGLSCYNKFELAKEIALFPLPVITGIGHSTNKTVAEMVAWKDAITPTKLAEFLVEKFTAFAQQLIGIEERLVHRARQHLQQENQQMRVHTERLQSVSSHILLKSSNQLQGFGQHLAQETRHLFRIQAGELHNFSKSIKREGRHRFNREYQSLSQEEVALCKYVPRSLIQQQQQLGSLERNLHNLSPKNVLKRGYSITRKNGKSVKSTDAVKKGDIFETELYEGKVISEVQSKKLDAHG